jgi:formylglycine-generating enzyme required for sulfatase activity
MNIRLFPALICAALLVTGCPTPNDDSTKQKITNPDEDEGGDDGTIYSVTIDPGVSGGALTAEPTSGIKGTEITLTVSPSDDRRELVPGSLKYVYGDTERPVNIVTRKFKLPAAHVTVTAAFGARYAVTVDPALSGILSADPPLAAAGAEITLTLTDPVAWRIKQGTLRYETGAGESVSLPAHLLTFTLPEADITVKGELEAWEDLIHRMVKVTGAVVTKSIGTGETTGMFSGGTPFFHASTTPVTVEDFSIAAVEVTYQLWYTVKTWALNHGYSFPSVSFGAGAEQTENGGAYGYNYGEPSARRYTPAVWYTWFDIIVWLNAYSEWAKDNLGPDYGNFEPLYKTTAGAPGGAGAVIKNSDMDSLKTLLGTRGSAPDAGSISVPAHDAQGFRLPANREWEFAARGGDPSAEAWSYTYAGSSNIDEVAWYQGNTRAVFQEAGNKAPNTLSLYDMTGNAWEMVQDLAVSASGITMLQCGGFVMASAAENKITARSGGNAITNILGEARGGFRVAGPASVGVNP